MKHSVTILFKKIVKFKFKLKYRVLLNKMLDFILAFSFCQRRGGPSTVTHRWALQTRCMLWCNLLYSKYNERFDFIDLK